MDADFDVGTLVNVHHNVPNNDQLQLDSQATPFGFIWVAASGRGTVVKIDTDSGDVLGEYLTAPGGGGNPSRTTVDSDGSVWVANRNLGSVVHIGLKENGQCRNGGATTSSGLGNILTWNSASPPGVGDAQDDCIIHYQIVSSAGTRHVSVNSDNDVWVSGTTTQQFDLIKGGGPSVAGAGTILRTEPDPDPNALPVQGGG